MRVFLWSLLATLPAVAQVESVRIHYGDDMRWAGPDFDDSGWADGNAPIDIHEHLLETWYWARYKVRVPERFLDLVVGSSQPLIEVYVEGRLIGASGKFPPNYQDASGEVRTWPIPADLAVPGRVLTIATRLWQYPGRDLRRLTGNRPAPPIWVFSALETPLYAQQQRMIVRARIWGVAITAVLILFLLMGGRRQWAQKEFQLLIGYLALHIAGALMYIFGHYLPFYQHCFAYIYFNYAFTYVLQLELLANLTLVQPAWWLRAAQACSFLFFAAIGVAALLAVAPPWLSLAGPAGLVLLFISLPVCAVLLVRQRAESLAERLVPLGLGLVFLADMTRIAGTNSGVQIGDALFTRNLLGNILFGAVLVAVRMYRFRRSEETATRLAVQFAAARGVQELLLTRDDAQSPEYEIETVYSPAEEVGGDFFRIIESAGGGRLVLVGDVSGKGLRAAMLVSVIAGVLLNRRSDEPASVLAELNRALYGQMKGGFVTCCAALLSAGGAVALANAGHPPAYRNGEEVDASAGLPLGVVADAEYQSVAFQLAVGERMVLLSDGVPEAANVTAELFGFDRTRAISSQSAADIAAAAKDWGQNDDITVVTVTREA